LPRTFGRKAGARSHRGEHCDTAKPNQLSQQQKRRRDQPQGRGPTASAAVPDCDLARGIFAAMPAHPQAAACFPDFTSFAKWLGVTCDTDGPRADVNK
jgi:hypothetical protein